ncbi:unnamed protein product [Allacma fusca]|uniref:Uncharacterized protein n=1 Tax=Allacma fusca TaxID=39272 RepID=A0A8J2KLH3_9HEXA|nr:unnamed protein product [Allacma fusca]
MYPTAKQRSGRALLGAGAVEAFESKFVARLDLNWKSLNFDVDLCLYFIEKFTGQKKEFFKYRDVRSAGESFCKTSKAQRCAVRLNGIMKLQRILYYRIIQVTEISGYSPTILNVGT